MESIERSKRLKLRHETPHIPAVNKVSNEINHFEKLILPSEQFALRLNEKLQNIYVGRLHKQRWINEFLQLYRLNDDPLQHWLDYMCFVKSNPFRSFWDTSTGVTADSQLVTIMKRCTFALLHHPKYAVSTHHLPS